jgi:hypothetical protein
MQIIETDDPVEAQRCRRVQYSGNATAITLRGSEYVGVIKSVKLGRGGSSQSSQKRPKPSHGRDIGPDTLSKPKFSNKPGGLSAKRAAGTCEPLSRGHYQSAVTGTI